MANTVSEKVAKELELVKVFSSGIASHGDHSTELFGSRKPC